MSRFKIILFVIAAICLGVGLIWASMPKATIRYRLTLTASVDGVPVTGSGVIEVRYVKPPDWSLDSPNVEAHVRGEAVVLDMGNRGMLFALLFRGPQHLLNRLRDFVPHFWGRDRIVSAEDVAWVAGLKGARTVALSELPFLVHFRDISDPTSVEQVTPDNLAASFGPGVELKSATIEITDAPVTTGITAKLPWLSGISKKRATLDGGDDLIDPDSSSLSSHILSYYFMDGV